MAPAARPTFYHPGAANSRTHRYRLPGYPVYPYPSYVVGYLPYDLFDDSFDNYDPYSGAAAQPEQGYYPQPDYGYSQPAPQPVPQPPAVPLETQSVSGPADTVTLIFKNGRPPEHIRSYLATSTTLTVIDGDHHHDIPIAELDVPATIKANRDTGAGFQLPTATP